MSKEINVLALIKGEERYIFLYDDNNRTETLRTLGRFAADPQLSFSWYDAAVAAGNAPTAAKRNAQPKKSPNPFCEGTRNRDSTTSTKRT